MKFDAKSIALVLALVAPAIAPSAAAQEREGSCKVSGRDWLGTPYSFDGFVRHQIHRNDNKEQDGLVWTTAYRIVDWNNRGRHQANVDLYLRYERDGRIVTQQHNSPDSMRQDGQWNPLRLSIPFDSRDRLLASWVKITFDKPGGDPSCIIDLMPRARGMHDTDADYDAS